MGWGDGDLPQLGYWEAGVGDGDKVGWDNEMGEGDRDRAEGGLSAEAESSENLRAEGDRASVKVYQGKHEGRDGIGHECQQQQQQEGYLCLLRGLWLLQLSLLLCCSLLLSSLMILGFILDAEW